jgi:major vault protein
MPCPLTVVKDREALKLEASINFTSRDGTKRIAGDRWLFKGPSTYYP